MADCISILCSDYHSGLPSQIDILIGILSTYPLVTSILWSLSGIHYLLNHRAAKHSAPRARPLMRYSVVIPFHAEPDAALAAVRSLQSVVPAPAEIVIVDDGSPSPIPSGMLLPAGTRMVRLDRNRGKAGALQAVLPSLRTEVIVCMDADTESESSDWSAMLSAFDDASLGAITGKIRPTEGGGLVEWFQALDYLTVIAVIKSAETSWGGLLTVSGAFTAYRVSALRSVGGWNNASSTEDIDVSWRLQSAGWRLAFESDWIARVEMAPSLGSLWRQRRRWSAGLGRALRDHGAGAFLNGARHLPIVILTLSSLVWMLTILTLGGLFGLGYAGQTEYAFPFVTDQVVGLFLIGMVTFSVQLATAMVVDGRSLTRHWRSMLIAPFYPAYFWFILLTSFVAGFPKGILRRDNGNWRRTLRRIEAKTVA